MFRYPVIVLILTATVAHSADDTRQLPTPHYHQQTDDPEWLAYAAQFHGHLGPWATAGLRIGMVGRRAVGANGYFDIDVTVSGPFAKPPKSCFLDGLQVSTGATWGKRNIRWKEQEEIVVEIKNTRSGETAHLRPTAALMDLLTSFKPNASDESRDDHQLETIARKIVQLPEAQVVQLRRASDD